MRRPILAKASAEGCASPRTCPLWQCNHHSGSAITHSGSAIAHSGSAIITLGVRSRTLGVRSRTLGVRSSLWQCDRALWECDHALWGCDHALWRCRSRASARPTAPVMAENRSDIHISRLAEKVVSARSFWPRHPTICMRPDVAAQRSNPMGGGGKRSFLRRVGVYSVSKPSDSQSKFNRPI